MLRSLLFNVFRRLSLREVDSHEESAFSYTKLSNIVSSHQQK